jgi:ABC-type nitrate/sulfonate/bicarbonate transport system substrate-binding protein
VLRVKIGGIRWSRNTFLIVLFVLLFAGIIRISSAATLAGDSSHPSGRKELKKVTLGRPAISLTILPLLAADKKGFFVDEGIELQWVNIRPDLAMVSLITNQLDYSCAGTRSVQAAASGMPIKTIIVVNDRPQHGLVGQPDIPDAKALKGKSFAIGSRGTLNEWALESILRANGIRLNEVNVIQIGGNDPNRVTALKNKVIDAAILGVPFDQQLVKEGFKYLGAARNHLAVTVGDLAVSNKKLAENPDEVTRMVRAALKGLRYVHSNKEDTIAIIATNYKIDKDLARAAYDAVIDTFPKDGLPTKGAVENTIEMAKPKEPFKAEQAVDFRILNKLLKEGGVQ